MNAFLPGSQIPFWPFKGYIKIKKGFALRESHVDLENIDFCLSTSLDHDNSPECDTSVGPSSLDVPKRRAYLYYQIEDLKDECWILEAFTIREVSRGFREVALENLENLEYSLRGANEHLESLSWSPIRYDWTKHVVAGSQMLFSEACQDLSSALQPPKNNLKWQAYSKSCLNVGESNSLSGKAPEVTKSVQHSPSVLGPKVPSQALVQERGLIS